MGKNQNTMHSNCFHSTVQLNDFWVFSFASCTWTEIATPEPITEPTTFHRMMPIYDSVFFVLKNAQNQLYMRAYDFESNTNLQLEAHNTELIEHEKLQEFAIVNINDHELLFFGNQGKLFRMQFPQKNIVPFTKKMIYALYDTRFHFQTI